ncbi:MAG: hypothetical protein ACKOCQ_03665 [Candidatus Nitrosotenuis sp.]
MIISSQIQFTQAEDTPKGNKLYPFAEDVSTTAIFKFNDGSETADFQLFSQTSGFGNNGRGSTPEFVLQKVVGDTPYLHKQVALTHERSNRVTTGNSEWEFDVTVNMVQGPKTLIAYEYTRCLITGYKINTEYDKSESFTGKDAFAVLEQYTITCGGYNISSVDYDQMMQEKQNQKPYE